MGLSGRPAGAPSRRQVSCIASCAVGKKSRRRGRRAKVGGRPLRLWALGGLLAVLVVSVWLAWPYWRLSGQFGQLEVPRPSRLYGLPMTVSPGDFIGVAQLEAYLADLGYRSVESSPTQGTYRRSSAPVALEAFLRPYPTLQGWTSPQRLRLVFSGRWVARLELAGRAVEEVVLEPPVLASFYGSRRIERRPVSLENLPTELVLAVLAAEDDSFFEHAGISASGILRAAWINLRRGEIVQGGSTLTQQLVKNLYLTHERTFLRKLREGLLSIFLEFRFEKNQLLKTYLNEIYWGNEGPVSLLGVGAAARAYFAKEANELTLNEVAVLAGMIRSPGRLDPRRHAEASLARRNLVLRRLVELEWIEPERAEATLRSPLPTVVPLRPDRHQGYVLDAVRREARERFGLERLAGEGLALLSSLDADDQRAAEESLAKGLEALEPGGEGSSALQGVLLSVDPRDGGVRAYVGGRDYQASQFDRIAMARRQPGSAFKPVVFSAAFSNEVASPATLLEDAPLTLRIDGKTWTPQNNDRQFRGWVSAREVLERSINVATVRLADRVGWERVVQTARKLGITSSLKPLPSLALGAFEVTPLELMTVYSTLANGGLRSDIHLLRGVLSSEGRVFSVADEAAPVRVLDEGTAFLVNHVLQGALDHGTGRGVRARGFRDPLAGKTGTTNRGRDSWFIGYAPNRATLVWVGYDDNRATKFSGSKAALPIWTLFAEERRPALGYSAFEPPPSVRFVPIDLQTGQLASGRCREVGTEPVLVSSFPLELCALHSSRSLRERSRRPPDERRPWWKRVFRRRN